MATWTATKAPQALDAAFDAAWGAATLKVMLTSGYTFDPDTHVFKSSVTGEVAGTGYTAGGMAVPSGAWSYDAATNTFKITGNAAVWSASSITADGAVFYLDTGVAATSPILVVWSGTAQTSVNGNFTVTPNAGGLATVA